MISCLLEALVEISFHHSQHNSSSDPSPLPLPTPYYPNVFENISPKCWTILDSTGTDSSSRSSNLVSHIYQNEGNTWREGQLKLEKGFKKWLECSTVNGTLSFKLEKVNSLSLMIYLHESMGSVTVLINETFVEQISGYLNTSSPAFAWLGKGRGIPSLRTVMTTLSLMDPFVLSIRLDPPQASSQFNSKFQLLAVTTI